MSSTSQDRESTGKPKVVPAAQPPPVSAPKAVTKVPNHDLECEDSDDMDDTTRNTGDMDTGGRPNSDNGKQLPVS